MKVSVITTVWNVAEWIDKNIQAFLSQTLKDIEIICVDDGSPDNSAQIVTEYIEEHKDKNIKLIRKPNGGLSSARNAALDVAEGEYVYFMDADDELANRSALEQLVVMAWDYI